MKFKYRIIFFLIGIAGMVALILTSDLKHQPWEKLWSYDALVLLLHCISVWVGIYIVHSIAYLLIMREDGKKVPFHVMLRVCTCGFALNSVTPAGLVGGEPYRIMALKRHVSVERATSATLTFSLMYTFGHFLLWIIGSITYFAYGLPGPLWVSILLGIMGGLLIIVGFLFVIKRNNGFAYPAMRFLSRLPILRKKLPAVVEKNKNSYIEIDDNIREFRGDPIRYVSVLSLELGSRLLEAFEYYLILKFFATGPVTYLDGLLVMSTASLIGNLLFIVPMQAGTRESGTKIALDFLGEVNAFGPVFLLYRIREFIFIAVGIILVLFGRKNQATKKEQLAVAEETIITPPKLSDDNESIDKKK